MDQMEDDRLWFEAHPNRKYRLRDPIDGELAATMWGESHVRAKSQLTPFVQETERAGWRTVYLVIQLAPGVRMRQLGRVSRQLFGIAGENEPLDSLTDRGIEILFPGISSEMPKNLKPVRRLDGGPNSVMEPVSIDLPRSH